MRRGREKKADKVKIIFEGSKEDQGRKAAVLVMTNKLRKRGRGRQGKEGKWSFWGSCSRCSTEGR